MYILLCSTPQSQHCSPSSFCICRRETFTDTSLQGCRCVPIPPMCEGRAASSQPLHAALPAGRVFRRLSVCSSIVSWLPSPPRYTTLGRESHGLFACPKFEPGTKSGLLPTRPGGLFCNSPRPIGSHPNSNPISGSLQGFEISMDLKPIPSPHPLLPPAPAS